MGHRPNCRSCQHCLLPSGLGAGGAEDSWCRMRRLAIHAELASELWCHHWTARPPQLPELDGASILARPVLADRQLALTELLAAAS